MAGWPTRLVRGALRAAAYTGRMSTGIRCSISALNLLATAALLGCSASAPAGPGSATAVTRWLLTWHRAVPEDAAALRTFEADISKLAGVPVHHVTAVSDRVRAVVLDCADGDACARARDRLRADRRVVALVPDERRRTHIP